MKQIIKNFQSQVEIFEEKLKSFSERERKNRVLDDIIESDYSLRDFEEQFEYIKRISKNLLKNHKWFFSVVWKNDITNLENNFSSLNSYLDSASYHALVTYLNNIKEILWKYNFAILSKNEYISDFNEELINLQWLLRDVELKLQEIEKDLEIKNWIVENIDDLREKYDELESKIQDITDNHSASSELLNEIKEHKEKFDDFVEKIDDRENKINEQNISIQECKKQFDSLNKEYKDKLGESEKLISSAKQALNYKTAEWISAAIQSQYNEAKSSKLTRWIVMAAIFLISSLLIGFFTLFPITLNLFGFEIKTIIEFTIYSFLARISLMVLLIWACIFCASQYTKQKNIIEDYAYKLVLAKSIIWFSEELKKWWEEWYQKYITKTLDELLQDPLRNKDSREITNIKLLKDFPWIWKDLSLSELPVWKALDIINNLTKK